MKVLVVGVILLSAAVSGATDRYVSSDGKYGEGLGVCYTDLQTAVSEAEEGETVWVQDGFVCSAGSSKGNDQNSRIVVSKAILVRSESGYVDEANGKGAKIVGQYDSDAAPVGNNAIRCVFLATGSELRGFILEKGSTKNHYPYGSGGGAGGFGTLSHCLVRDCWANYGGGAAFLGRCEDCDFENNQTTNTGATLFDVAMAVRCRISGSDSLAAIGCKKMTSPYFYVRCVVTNCTVFCNRSKTNGGGAFFSDSSLEDFDVYDTVISNNVAGQHGGAAFTSNSTNPIRFHHCDFIGNVAGAVYNGCNGGAANNCFLEDCLVAGNCVTNGFGGACAASVLVGGCVVTNNFTAGTANGNGGALYNCTATNCVITHNTARDSSHCMVYAGVAVGCTIRHSSCHGVEKTRCEDCTIVDNVGTGVRNVLWISGGMVARNGISGISLNGSQVSGVPVVSNCTIACNVTTGNQGAGLYTDNTPGLKVYDCVISNNCIASGGYLGGGASANSAAKGFTLYRCKILNNVLVGSGNAHGGGVSYCRLEDCEVRGNVVTNGNGGGVYEGETRNCVIADNLATGGGSGAYHGAHYNALFVGNRETAAFQCNNNYPGGTCAVNCTFAENEGAGFSYASEIVNCISWGNGVPGDVCKTCSDSCVQSLTATTQERVIDTDPRLGIVDGLAYVPRSRGCRNTAQRFDWMSDPTDVRSHDVYGRDRIIGSGPDMGAVEAPTAGLLLMVR